MRFLPLLAVIALAGTGCTSDQSPPPESPTSAEAHPDEPSTPNAFLIDLQSAVIGGVDLDQPVDALRERMGEARIRVETEYREGEPTDIHVISFGDHRVRRDDGGVVVTDPAFRTADSLGVGVPLEAFNRVYGPSPPDHWGEGLYAALYELPGAGPEARLVFASIPTDCRGEACVVEALRIVLLPESQGTAP